MSAPIPPADDANHWEIDEADRSRAAAALRAAFERLQPQGSDAWNFLGAFTHLGDRYGPYQPGASALSAELGDQRAPAKRGGRLGRLVANRSTTEPPEEKSELEDAMGWVVEAFRFLSSRVTALEDRLAREDRPVEGAAWLVPARALGPLTESIAAYVAGTTPRGPVLHADSGDGALLLALAARQIAAVGVEPRGAIALGPIEHGCQVSINEVVDDLAARTESSLGGLVLSSVTERLPLHAVLTLLSQARRTLALGAPLVLVAGDPAGRDQWDPAAADLITGHPLHLATWAALLERAGFVDIAPLGTDGEGQWVLTASAPR
ncbi:MAG TPA: hypothetical protein VGG38_00720 [Acidimicrobiales bacterium]